MNNQNQEFLNQEIEKIINNFNKKIYTCMKLSSKKNKGGVIRSRKGELGEKLIEQILNLVQKIWNIENNTTVKLKIKKESLPIVHPVNKDYVYNIILDRVIYINNEKWGYVESKAYCDLSMMKRALFDNNMIYKKYPNMKSVLFEIEQGISIGSGSYEVLKSFNEKNIDYHISLFETSRSSIKEIHKKNNVKFLTNHDVLRVFNYFKDIFDIEFKNVNFNQKIA